MIRTEQLCKAFGRNTAIDRVSMHVREGEIFGLVGPDGAGKTTLLRMICGLITPDSGNIFLMGLTHQEMERNKDKLGYLPQRFSLYGDLTVWENVEFFGSLYGLSVRTIRERADEVLEITGLLNFKKRLAEDLSGGMKQKLALTCALITRPRILVLDEPTNGVDPESRREFWWVLYHFNREGMTVLISTSYLNEAELCHTVGFLAYGRLVLTGVPLAIKKKFPYQLLEVRAEVSDPAVFEELDGVAGASPYGEGYHLALKNPAEKEIIENALRRKGIRLCSIREVSPSMEDVYMFMVEEKAVSYGECSRDPGAD